MEMMSLDVVAASDRVWICISYLKDRLRCGGNITFQKVNQFSRIPTAAFIREILTFGIDNR